MKMLSYTTKRLSWGASAPLEAWGTLWTQPVAAVNETSPVLGQAGWTQRSSKRKRTLAEGGGILVGLRGCVAESADPGDTDE